MKRLEFLEEYFIEFYKKFGICRLKFELDHINLEDKDLRNMIFKSSDFAQEFEKLTENCMLLGKLVKRGFQLIMKRDMCNNYYVLIN